MMFAFSSGRRIAHVIDATNEGQFLGGQVTFFVKLEGR